MSTSSSENRSYYLYKNQVVTLSKRENDCLVHILQGQNAKETGISLNLSSRTIEHYIASIRKKFKCHTKFEILKKFYNAEITSMKR